MITEYQNASERLKHAVHRHKAVSKEGLTERLFTLLFTGLVYPQIWEDPEVDMEAMQINEDSHVVAIASGGCNVMSYLTANPARITAVDLNRAHIALNRLKLAGAAHMPSYEHFYSFFGNANDPQNPDRYRRFMRDYIDDETFEYWERCSISGRKRITLFARNFYKHGLLGIYIGLSHLFARLYGVTFKELMACKTLEEQRDFYERKIAPLFDKRLVSWVTSKPASLYGLGIPPSQYEALAGDREMRFVLRERLETLICNFPIRENYFAAQAFARRYVEGGEGALPPYLKRESFASLQANASRVQVLNKNFTEFLRAEPDASADRYVLLDAQDWMTDEQLNDLWDQITRTAKPGARVIFRTAAEPSLLPGRVRDETLARWDYRAEESLAFTKADRSSIYGGFHLYVLRG
ncbi:MAG: DUF3419 family protein [Rhizobiales bacterium]|nr:DUF3419 family protein [Hyphomicrobiales bacterium]